MTRSRWQPGPAQPHLDAETVDVWLIALDGAQPLDTLSAEDRERAARFVRDEDRCRWSAARAALRALLGAYADADPRALRFVEGPHGKPELARATVVDGPRATASTAGTRARTGDLRFNLSHSGDVALIAVASAREVGVDVELPRARPVDHVAIARRALAPADAAQVAAIADPAERERAFLRAWTRWEAVLKCHGTGIGGPEPTSDGPAPWVIDLPIAAPAAAALAVERGPCAVRTWRWPPANP